MFLRCLISLLPWFLKRKALIRLYDYDLHEKSFIGISFVFPKQLSMKEGARIGNFNVVKGLDKLSMDDSSVISTFNWIFSHPKSDDKFFLGFPDRKAELELCEHSAITSRHLIDCTDKVRIGRFTTVAGFRTQILTHSIDLAKNVQACKPITIGDYCFVGTGSILLSGNRITDKVVVGGGSVVSSDLMKPLSLYGGQPARHIKDIVDEGYFVRHEGEVV